MTISEKLKALRKEKNMTISDIHRLTGVAIGTIGDVERGKIQNPGIYTIEKIARALGVSTLYFLDDDPGMNIKHSKSGAGKYLYQEQFINLLNDKKFVEYFMFGQAFLYGG